MTPNMIMALIGALVATCATIASALVFVITSSKAAGRREGKLDDALTKLVNIDKSIEAIPDMKATIAQHGSIITGIRSDYKDLRSKVDALRVIQPTIPRPPTSPEF